MSKGKCYLCNNKDLSTIHYGTRGNPNINVEKCNVCGLVQLNEIMNNPDEFYENSGMRKDQDINIKHIRVTALSDDERRFNMVKPMISNKKVLDFGCGAGGFLKMAQDVCEAAQGVELEELMRKALAEDCITCFSSLDDAKKKSVTKYDLITFFHVIEHLPDPIEILESVSDLLAENGKIIIEVPNCDDALLSLYQSESFADFTYWECHLFLYNNETLKKMVEKAGYRVNMIRQIQRYPLSNALYWLANGKPGGHIKWGMMNDSELDNAYGNMLSKLGRADTIIAEIERKK